MPMIGRSGQVVRLVHVTTVPITLDVFFRGQIGHLKSRGFEVSAITSPDPLVASIAAREGIEIDEVPMSRSIAPFADLLSLWRLWRCLRRRRPQIVHSHTPKAALLGTLAARFAGVRVVALSIFGLPQTTRRGPLRHLLDRVTRLSCRLADLVWCDSPSIRDLLHREKLCPVEKLHVFASGSVKGVDAAGEFSPSRSTAAQRAAVRASRGIGGDALVLGFLGRLTASKGVGELAQAWRELRERRPDLHLLLVGPFDSHDSPSAADRQLLHGDPRVHLTGMVEDVAAHLAAMDIFVLPSYREGLVNANLEAAAMALPVISTRVPGCMDTVVDGVTGTLVPAADSKALVEAIDRYCDDAELRRRHGRAGRARMLREFRPEPIWEALEAEYRRLLAAEARPRPT